MHAVIRWRTQIPRLPHPWHLGKAFVYPYVGVVGLFTALLALCWTLLGVNPIEACVDFLVESAIVLSPLMLKLGIIWLVYTAAYALSLFLVGDSRSLTTTTHGKRINDKPPRGIGCRF